MGLVGLGQVHLAKPGGTCTNAMLCPQGPFTASGRALCPLNEGVNGQTKVCRVATLFIVYTLLDNREGLVCISPEHGPLGLRLESRRLALVA